MKKIILAIFIVLVCIKVSFGQDKGINFRPTISWAQIKEQAKKENKYIFIDLYATWCAPCKMMDSNVYSNEAVGKMMEMKFLSFKFQIDKTKKDDIQVKARYSDAEMFARNFKIGAFPSFLFFSPAGVLLHKSEGYRDTAAFKVLVLHALTDPLKKLKALTNSYQKGRRDSLFLRTLANEALNEKQNNTSLIVSGEFIKRLKNPYMKDNLDFIFQFTTRSIDPGFTILFNHVKKVNAVIGNNAAEDKIMKIIYDEEIAPYLKNPNWKQIEKTASKKFGKLGEERVWGTMVVYYLDNNDWDNFGKYYKLYFDRAIPNNRSFLHMNNMTWPVFEHVDNQGVLESAIKTMVYSIDKFDMANPNAYDTYANLLYKIGRIEQAFQAEMKAIEISQNGQEYIETLERMKNGTSNKN